MVIAQDAGTARTLADGWRAAVPGVTAEARDVAVAPPPAPVRPGSVNGIVIPDDAGPGTASGDAAPLAGPEPWRPAVVVAGTRLSVGAPPPEPPGPTAPRSALPVAEAAVLSHAAAASDVVVAHVPVLDAGSLRAGPVAEAAAAAAPHAVPVVALAGRVEVSRRELAAAGVSGAHEIEDDDVARVARSWTPHWA